MTSLGSQLRRLFAIAIALTTIMSSISSEAALIVYEGFDYPDGTSLRNQTGGIGWSGGWTNTGNATETATAPGLTYPNMTATGNKATLAGQQINGNGNNAFLARDLAQTFGTDGTTLWLSFIGQRTGNKSTGGTQPNNYQRVFSLGLFNTSATEQASIGELTDDTTDVWNLNADTTLPNSVDTTVPIDTQSFLLLRIDFVGANTDKAYLWVNPDLSLGEPSIGTQAASITDELTFNRIRLTVGGSTTSGARLAASGLFDEIRIADTFAEAIPEPASAALALLSLAGLVANPRRPRTCVGDPSFR